MSYSTQSERRPRHILVTGSTGFIGRALVARLHAAGDTVVPLLRGASTAGLHWDPGAGSLQPELVSGFDAVIHLAGEPVVGRWTRGKKQRIFNSRVQGTSQLVAALSRAEQPPRIFLCASGINFYGNTGDQLVDEKSPPGDGFLAEVCKAWEKACEPLNGLARVSSLRIGVVLDPFGGALSTMLPIFRRGFGAVAGDGHGYVSWITLEDLLLSFDYFLDADGKSTNAMNGPFNIVAPNPVTARTFSNAIAAAVGRAAVLSVPACPVRLVLGEVAEETILGSVRAVPARLLAGGFEFRQPTLERALASLRLSGR